MVTAVEWWKPGITDMVYLLACRLHIAQLTLFYSYYKP